MNASCKTSLDNTRTAPEADNRNHTENIFVINKPSVKTSRGSEPPVGVSKVTEKMKNLDASLREPKNESANEVIHCNDPRPRSTLFKSNKRSLEVTQKPTISERMNSRLGDETSLTPGRLSANGETGLKPLKIRRLMEDPALLE